MSDLSRVNPVGRFDCLATLYAKHRPTYPRAALDYIVEQCRLGPDTLLVDVGCGTGISTRLFAARDIPTVGIEPNDAMRAEAEATPADGPGRPRYQKGHAEVTLLPDGCAKAVLAAQAFHWFDAPRALAEFHRILEPDGHVALIWNERDETDRFTAAYGEVLRSVPETASVEGPRATAGEALLQSPRFAAGRKATFANAQELDEEGLLGRAFSVSYAPREPAAAATFANRLRELFRAFRERDRVTLHYVTSIFLARKHV
jgi:ubiquinone/menaquinone biosynthesis C-methylase UbiE